MIRLHTFGGCFLERGGRRMDSISGQRKALALLLVLAAAGERGVTRDTLIGYFWPESDEERARTSLRQLVHLLRTQLAAPDLLLSSAELRLNPAEITSDVADFRKAVAAGDLNTAAELYQGSFAEGFYLSGTDEFERWIATERADLAHNAARALESLAENAMARGDGRAAVDLWRRLAQNEPLSTRATLGLMRALDSTGERAAALKHAREYERLVREDLDGAPDPGVVALAAELQRERPLPPISTVARISGPAAPTHSQSSHAPAAALHPGRTRPTRSLLVALVILIAGIGAGAVWLRGRTTGADTPGDELGATASVPRIPSVAVLPFANVSRDTADDPLADGLTEELIGALAKVPGLKVTGRTSSFVFKTRTLDLRQIADTLGVISIVDGSMRRVGDRLKVNAQLVNAADGSVLWAEQYDGELSDLFTMQEKIARAIVGALRLKLVGSTELALARQRPTDIRAYEMYVRGRHIFTTRTNRDAALQAAEYFRQALSLDSTYAQAYAGLADVHTRLGVFGFEPPLQAYARAKTAALRALTLDSTIAEAHAALGHLYCVADFDWRASERAFRRAIALNPNYGFARLPFAICLMAERRFNEAAAQLDTARSIDPLSPAPSNVFGRLYVSMRRPDDAIRHLRQALELSPQMDLAFQQLGYAYLQKRMPEQAVVAFQRAAALSGARDSAQMAYAYAVTGRRDDAQRIVRDLLAAPQGVALSYHLATAYAGLGNKDEAFRWLMRGYTERGSFMTGMNVDPAFEILRGDPRWAALLQKMGLDPH